MKKFDPKKVLRVITKHPGCSVTEIAKKLKVSRPTVIKARDQLLKEKKIKIKKVGPVKLHYLR